MNENDIGKIIIDTAIEIHRGLGPGLLESVYEVILTYELVQKGLSVKRQVAIPIEYHGIKFYEGFRADQVAKYLGKKGIFVWAGHFYAAKLVEKLGLSDTGGLIRVGIAPYNTQAELDRLLEALKDRKSLAGN